MGMHNGAVGLCSRESRHFYAVPLVAHALQTARPDLWVHVLLENAGAMRDEHRDAILQALALSGCSASHAMTADAIQWTSFPRRRLF
eukprot:12433742-Prorocentrum_lima.AAC.1